jgi:DNA-directed RNA polymerase II subunit RPB9
MVKFCPECNNLLYPKENKQHKRLYYFCKTCDHIEESDVHLIYTNNLKIKSSTDSSSAKDLFSDPTYPHSFSVNCPKCGNNEAIFFVNTENVKEKPLDLTYICTNIKCGEKW